MTPVIHQVKLWGTRQKDHAIWSAMLFLMIAFVIGAATVGIALSILQSTGFMPQRNTYTMQTLASTAIIFGAIMAAVIVSAHIWARWMGYEGVKFIGLDRDFGKFFVGALWGIGLQTLMFLMLATFNWLQIDSVTFDRQAIISVLVITISSLNAGVMEEVVFRGALYSALRSRWSRWIVAVAVSVCFLLYHFINNSYEFPVSAALGLFAGGLLFTWIREITGGLWAPIGLHSALDAAIGWFNLAASTSPRLLMTTYTVPTWLVGEFGASDWVLLFAFAVSVWVYQSRMSLSMNVHNTLKS